MMMMKIIIILLLSFSILITILIPNFTASRLIFIPQNSMGARLTEAFLNISNIISDI